MVKTKIDLDRQELRGFRGWVLKTRNGQYLALDDASGGYPYLASGIRNIFVWQTKEDAEKYRSVFSGGSQIGRTGPAAGWRAVEIMLIEVPREK